MKRIHLLSCLSLLAALIGSLGLGNSPAQGQKDKPAPAKAWEKERCLTTGPGPRHLAINFARCLAADEAGRVHVVWHEARDGNDHAVYKRSLDEGKTWEADVSLSNSSERMPSHAIMPSVATAGPNVYAVWHELRKGKVGIYFRRSSDGGKSWDKAVQLSNGPKNSTHASVSATGSDVHVVWVDQRERDADVYYRRSTDAGATWTDEKRLNEQGEKLHVSYVPCITASEKAVFLAWVDTRDGNEEEYLKISQDRGATWGKDVRMTNDSANSWAPSLAVSGKAVHFLWFDQMDSPIRPAAAEKKLNDVMKLLGLPELGTGPSGVWVPHPELAAKQRAGERMNLINKESKAWIQGGGDEKKLEVLLKESKGMTSFIEQEEKLDEAIKLMGLTYVPGPLDDVRRVDQGDAIGMRVKVRMRKIQAATPAWIQNGGDKKKLDAMLQDFNQSMAKATKEWEIYYRRSTDLGATWGATVRLTNSPGLSFRPSVAAAGDDVHVVWWDDRDGNNEVYYKHSGDGGVKWGEDTRLTNAPGDSHYPCIAVSSNYVHVIWLDSRDGSPQIYYLRKPRK